MATILLISFTDLKKDPRVFRQIEALRPNHQVLTAGAGDPGLPGVRFIGCKRQPRSFPRKIASALRLLWGRYDSYYWDMPHVVELHDKLKGLCFDLAVANEIESLPLALKVSRERPVVLDAHEYSPLEFEDQWVWRVFFAHYKDDMCRRFMARAAAVTTVGQGIADRYAQEYGIRVEVISNAAHFYDLPVRLTEGSQIRMIHHGAATVSRRIDLMIDLMGYLDERFSLDLVLVPGSPDYIEWIKRRASGKPNIRFLDAVPMDQLVTLCSQYDIGVFLLPPTNFNYRMALPNKFFEFIQARLAVAIGPSPEMAQIVRNFGCGVVADDFAPASLAHALNQLSSTDIDRMKAGSDRTARVYTAETNAEKLREIVTSVLKEF